MMTTLLMVPRGLEATVWNHSKTLFHIDYLRIPLIFPGWLCHFKGPFITIWREIDRSKIPPR